MSAKPMSAKPLISPPGAPIVKISRRGLSRLKQGHVWIYRSDIVSAESVPPGALVSVKDERGKFLGSALYSSASQIAIRMISSESVRDLESVIRKRIRSAIAYRERVVRDTNAYRIVFSEADLLPGLIVDRYHEILSIQILTQAMDAARPVIVAELQESLKPESIVERVDPRVRNLEQLPARESGLLRGDVASTVFSMNGVRYHYDALQGQKTGAFLDQRENYAAAAKYAHGEALDVFCYEGGFALHMASNCSAVTGVDSSRPALEQAERNAALNTREIEWIEANAFDLLRDYSTGGRKFDTIVLDPPAFARNRQALDTALRGYKELNLRATKMLRPGGMLVSCSCSFHVGTADFLEIIAQAASDAHRIMRIVETRGQGADHPSLPNVPETSYLKCIIAYVS